MQSQAQSRVPVLPTIHSQLEGIQEKETPDKLKSSHLRKSVFAIHESKPEQLTHRSNVVTIK